MTRIATRKWSRHTQSGAALLTAMVIVTLVATLAAAMVWQQWRAVQVEAAERSRMQSAWILTGALDWARLILREDARNGGGDHLGEPWAVPLAEARLSTFLAADKDNTDDSAQAFLSGSILDAQARYNLRNLIDGNNKVAPGELAVLKRLCEMAGVSANVADQIATGLRDAHSPPTNTQANSDAPLRPETVKQLAWLGVDAASLQRLSPHVVLLPGPAPINLNTATREVISAVIEGLDLGSAERLVQIREQTPFKNLDEAKSHLIESGAKTVTTARADTRSSYFEVLGRLRLEDRILQERSLVKRESRDVKTLRREKVNFNNTKS